MVFRSVGNRIAVDIDALGLDFPGEIAMALLYDLGYRSIRVDLVALARSRIGKGRYVLNAHFAEAPATVDCSTFMKWLYGERGIWLPRKAVQQSEVGRRVDFEELQAGDLVFSQGRIPLYRHAPEEGVGHVGLATGEGTVIHAKSAKAGIVEESLSDFIRQSGRFKGARRLINNLRDTITFQIPDNSDVETTDDVFFRLTIDFHRRSGHPVVVH